MKKWTVIKLIILMISLIATLLITILIPLSISLVYPGEYALLYKGIGKYIESTPYTNGRYFIGLTNHFIRFPSGLIQINLTDKDKVEVFLSNGQRLEVQCILYAKLNNVLQEAKLLNFYLEYGDHWLSFYSRKANDVISQVLKQYEADFILKNKANVKANLLTLINNSLSSLSSNILSLESLHIQLINFSSEFDKAVENKLIQQQMVKVQTIQSQLDITKKNHARVIRQSEADIESLVTEAQIYYNNTKVKSKKLCLESIMKTDAELYGSLNTDLELGKDLINFIYAMEESSFTANRVTNFNQLNVAG